MNKYSCHLTFVVDGTLVQTNVVHMTHVAIQIGGSVEKTTIDELISNQPVVKYYFSLSSEDSRFDVQSISKLVSVNFIRE